MSRCHFTIVLELALSKRPRCVSRPDLKRASDHTQARLRSVHPPHPPPRFRPLLSLLSLALRLLSVPATTVNVFPAPAAATATFFPPSASDTEVSARQLVAGGGCLPRWPLVFRLPPRVSSLVLGQRQAGTRLQQQQPPRARVSFAAAGCTREARGWPCWSAGLTWARAAGADAGGECQQHTDPSLCAASMSA